MNPPQDRHGVSTGPGGKLSRTGLLDPPAAIKKGQLSTLGDSPQHLLAPGATGASSSSRHKRAQVKDIAGGPASLSPTRSGPHLTWGEAPLPLPSTE